MNVVVVESPAKAKTIEKYLGPGNTVLATYGHVSDLEAKDGSVRPDDDFAMNYVVDDKSEKHLKAIAKALKQSEALLLATDPDREGEAISWHVLNYLKNQGALDGVTVSRVVFHEITREAVADAVTHPRDIDMDLVNAQQARRALDYLVGFTLSPVLWRKVPGSRSAGRVQSVALRLICAREQEIEAFVAREYWTVDALLTTAAGHSLTARLTHLDGDKLDKFSLANEAQAQAAVGKIEAGEFTVGQVERKDVARHPAPPFTTSTLQQEASRKLGFGARRTMQLAQKLYEGVEIGGEAVGLITYMRTDSVTLSNEALTSARLLIGKRFGADYLPESPRQYKTRSRNAQEAHEAIRPTSMARSPDAVAGYLDQDGLRLYELIWRRTLASQMTSARLEQVAADFVSADRQMTLRATGSVLVFDGFLKLYREGRDDDDEGDENDRRLPPLKDGEALRRGAVNAAQHFTEPLPRYTEATLVKRLEELGIGRPSTYASIISVIQDRDYVVLERKRFTPTDRGRLVTAFLESFFERYVSYDFTANLEDKLDEISNGKLEWKDVLREFWAAFSMAVEEISHLRVKEVLDRLDEVLAPHIFPADAAGGRDPRACQSCDNGRLSLKLGKYGAFLGCSNYPDCRFTRPLSTSGEDQAAIGLPKQLGASPEGTAVWLKKGPYGIYVQLGENGDDSKPKRVALPKGVTLDQVDLDMGLGLLSLPREVGQHPETNKSIVAGIGRFGPYLRHDGKYLSLRQDDDVLTIGLNRAVALLAMAGERRRGPEPLRVVGEHPDSGGEIGLFQGRYGPYLKHNGVIASLPKDVAPDEVSLAEAVLLLAARAARDSAKPGKPARRGQAGKPAGRGQSGKGRKPGGRKTVVAGKAKKGGASAKTKAAAAPKTAAAGKAKAAVKRTPAETPAGE